MNALKVLNAAAAHLFSWVWHQAQRNWAQTALVAFLSVALDIGLFALVVSCGWGTAILIVTVFNMTFWGLLSRAAGLVAGGAGIATDPLTPGISNDPKVFATAVWGAGSAITLAFGGIGSASLLLHTERSPLAFWTLILVGIVTHFLVKDSNRAPVWLKNFFENVYITTLTTGFIGMLLSVIIPSIFRTIMHVLSLWSQGFIAAISDIGMKGYAVLTGPFGWLAGLACIFWLLNKFGLTSFPFKKTGDKAVEGGKVVISTSAIVLGAIVVAILLFILMGGGGVHSLATSNGGGGNSVALPNMGNVLIHPISLLLGLLGLLVFGGLFVKSVLALFKGLSIGRASLAIIALIVLIWFGKDILPTFVGFRGSDRITQTPPKVHQDQGELLKLSIYPKERSWGESMSGALVQGDAVDSFLIADGTEIYVEKVVGWTESNFGTYLADFRFDGNAYIHPCLDDSLLQTPQAWASWFPWTRCPGPDTCVVQTPILVLRKPGGDWFAPKGVPLISGKAYVVHGGPYIAVGTIQWCSNGKIEGHYEVTLRLSRPAQPVAPATALYPNRGRPLPAVLFSYSCACGILFLLRIYCC